MQTSGASRRGVANVRLESALSVMPGRVPGIHVLAPRKTWMAGTSPAMTKKYPHESGQQLSSDAERGSQSNKLDTDSSDAVRLMASAIRGAIDRVRMLAALRTASVGWIESVITSSFSLEAAMRAAAPPDSTPWLI